MAKTKLEKAGLTKKESLVYEALLKWGELTPSQIFKETGVTREHIYNIAEELEGKELIERIPGRKIVTFRPLSPRKFKGYLQKKKDAVEEEEIALDDVFSQLENYYKLSSKKSEVTYFKGVEGIKHVYKRLFFGTKPKEVLVFRSIHDKELYGYIEKHTKELTEAGIKTRMLAPAKEEIRNKAGSVKLDREVRYIKDERFLFPTEISVIGSQVSFCSYGKEKMGAMIINKDLSETMTKLFELLWKTGKEKK